MNKHRLLLPITFGIALLLSSCGTSYTAPPKDPSKTATIKGGNVRNGIITYTWAIYSPEIIDDLPVIKISDYSEIVVSSGVHNVVVAAIFNRGFGVGPYTARGDLTMTFKPGANYIVNGRAQGSRMLLWIEDMKTKKPASKVLNVAYQNAPQAAFVPIIIPVR